MDKRVFWCTKSPLPEYHSISFEHPAISTFRLVANEFAEVTLGGQVHTPAPMTIKPPEQSANVDTKLTLAFPRAVVGRQFKQQLKLIQASGSRDPIKVRYAVYLGDTVTPQVTWGLFASDRGGIGFSPDTVQVTATVDNPLRRAVSTRYTPDVYTGLETL